MRIRKRTAVLAGLLGIVGISAAVATHQRQATEAEEEAARRDALQMLEHMKAQKAERDRLRNVMPYPDEALGGWTLPPSAWIEAEKRRYAMALTDFDADVLVVPAQVQGNGIERSNRSLMTAALAEALPKNLRIAPPELVARALGDGHRRIQRGEVLALAEMMGAQKIIWTYVGHRSDQQLHLYFEVLDRGGKRFFDKNASPQGIAFKLVPMPDQSAPIDIFREQLPRIVEKLGYAPTPAAPVPGTALPEQFPASLGDISGDRLPVAHQAFHLQLLATLTTKDAARAKERLFERSLLLAWRLPPDHPATRLLLARGYLGLQMRAAALAVLGEPASDAEHALVAALNGNLADIDRWRAKLGRMPLGLMAAIDATDIRYSYEQATAATEAESWKFVSALPKPWQQLAARRMADGSMNALRPVDLGPLLDLLGKEFPQAGPNLAQRLRGNAVIGRMDPTLEETTLASYFDPRLALSGAEDGAPRQPLPTTVPNRFHLLDFLVESGIGDVVRQARRRIVTQGLYQEGLDYLAGIETIYGGHPMLLKLRTYAEDSINSQAEPARREASANRISEMDRQATHLLKATDHQPSDRPSLTVVAAPERITDSRTAPGWLRESKAALVNATYSTDALTAVFSLAPTPEEKAQVLDSVSGRFAGSSEPVLLRAKLLKAQGKPGEARKLLADAAKAQLPDWEIYKSLAIGYFKEQRYQEAADAFAAYPGFAAGSQTPVLTVDNRAFQAGEYLYWRGEPALGVTLFRKIANSGTGSAANILSAARIAMFEQDYGTALGGFFLAVRRYNDVAAYRDYFGLLHLLGESDAAWEAFRIQAPRTKQAVLWDASLAGHRRAGLSHSQIVEWAAKSGFLTERPVEPMVFRYLALAAITDRLPDESQLSQLELLAKDSPPALRQAAFARAYRAIRQGDFARAESLLDAAMKDQQLADRDVAYLVPYYALAAAKAGKAEAAEQRLAGVKDKEGMDFLLARAILDGLAGKPDAIKGFHGALADPTYGNGRPLTMKYQLCDLAEQMFQLTGKPEYREFALRLARFNQQIQPWESWSHALVASLTPEATERREALKRAVYLDANSAWLGRLPAGEVATAKAAVQSKPPFVVKKKPGKEI